MITKRMSEVVFGLFSPNRYDIPEYNGYDTQRLKDRFRALFLMKSRDGVPDKAKGIGYLGENGICVDLPAPTLMQDRHYSQLINYKKLT